MYTCLSYQKVSPAFKTGNVGIANFSQRSLTRASRCPFHAPLDDRAPLDEAEEPFHDDAEHRDDDESGEDVRGQEVVAGVVDVPAKPAGRARDAEDEFGGDDGSPTESPRGFDAGDDGGESRGQEDAGDEPPASQSEITRSELRRLADRTEAVVGVQRHRPDRRERDDEDDRLRLQAKPDHREWQNRDRR